MSDWWKKASDGKTFSGKRLTAGDYEGLSGVSSGGSRTSSGSSSRSSGSSSSGEASQVAPRDDSKEENSFTEWLAKKGLDLLYDEYGKPIIGKAVFDLYMQEVAGATKVEKDGETYFVDEDGNRITDKESFAGARAASAATAAGMTSLWNSYLKNGKLEDKDFMAAGASGAVAGGGEYYKAQYGGQSDYWDSAMSGVMAGAGTALEGYFKEGEVDWEDTAWATAKGAVADAASDQGPAGKMFWGMAMQGLEDKMTANDTDASTMMGLFGSSMIGPVGGMLGSWYGAQLDKPNDMYIAVYQDQDKPPLYYENGQIQINPVVDVRHFLSNVDEVDGHVETGFDSAEEKMQRYASKVQEHQELAQEWQDAINNYENEDINTQYQIDRFIQEGKMGTGKIFGGPGGDQTGGRLPWLDAGTITDAYREDGGEYYGSYGKNANFDTASTNPEANDMDKGAVDNYLEAAKYYDGGEQKTDAQKNAGQFYNWMEGLNYDEQGYTYFNNKADRATKDTLTDLYRQGMLRVDFPSGQTSGVITTAGRGDPAPREVTARPEEIPEPTVDPRFIQYDTGSEN